MLVYGGEEGGTGGGGGAVLVNRFRFETFLLKSLSSLGAQALILLLSLRAGYHLARLCDLSFRTGSGTAPLQVAACRRFNSRMGVIIPEGLATRVYCGIGGRH